MSSLDFPYMFIYKLNWLEGKPGSSIRELINLILARFSTPFLSPFSLFLLEIMRLGYVLPRFRAIAYF